jgi:diguanylate cyclase
MRMALGKLAGDATAFNVKLTDSSERLGRLTKIEDIRELKKRISQEVHELNRAVTEKQKQDEQAYNKLNNRIETLQANLTQSKQEASIDPLTSIGNRGVFDKALEEWVTSHRKNQTPFVLAMFDIDNFKLINDAHGHQVGDRVLLCVAQWLRKYVRSTDCVARYGGEEFVVMLADTNLTDAEVRFKELLGNMAKSSYAYEKEGAEHVVAFTASCGLAEFSSNESGEDLLRRADEALYQAKKTGKNRVVPSKRQKNFWKTLSSALPRPNKT